MRHTATDLQISPSGIPGEQIDRFGVVASSLCAVHCAVSALLPAAFGVLGLGFLLAHQTEWVLTLIAIAFAAGALILGWRRHRSNWVAACLVLGIVGLLVSRGLESGSPHHDHHGDHHLSETENPAAFESTVHPMSTVPFETTVPPRDTAPPRNTAPPENRLAATPKEHHTEHTTHSRASVAIHDHDSHLAGTAVGVLAGMILLLGHALNIRRTHHYFGEAA